MALHSLHALEALAHLDQAEAANERISDLHRQAPTPENRSRIAETHQRQGHEVKSAEVHATLAVAEQIAALVALINGLDL